VFEEDISGQRALSSPSTEKLGSGNPVLYSSTDLPAVLGEYVWVECHVLASHWETMQWDGDAKPCAILGEGDGGGA